MPASAPRIDASKLASTQLASPDIEGDRREMLLASSRVCIGVVKSCVMARAMPDSAFST